MRTIFFFFYTISCQILSRGSLVLLVFLLCRQPEPQFLPLWQGCVTLTCMLQQGMDTCFLICFHRAGVRPAVEVRAVLSWLGVGGLPADGLILSPQDNQTDSGMVLASEEFEQLESRYRQESGLR